MSPRRKKPRYCGCRPKATAFKPSGIPMSELEQIPIYLEEIETMKLCDYDGLTQEAAGRKMGISRGTVQRILAGARQKTARALSECKALILDEKICK